MLTRFILFRDMSCDMVISRGYELEMTSVNKIMLQKIFWCKVVLERMVHVTSRDFVQELPSTCTVKDILVE